MRLTPVLTIVVAAGLSLAACGGGSSSPSSSSGAPAPTSSSSQDAPWMTINCLNGESVPSDTSAFVAIDGIDGVRVQTTTDGSTGAVLAPMIAVAAGLPPATRLVTVDLLPGAGDPVQPGSAVQVNYCGVGQTTRTMFDSSWVRGKPASFGLNQVIKGWTDGIPGMKPGGRRLLIIPADEAYGDNPRDGSGILPGETLIFVVDMIASSK